MQGYDTNNFIVLKKSKLEMYKQKFTYLLLAAPSQSAPVKAKTNTVMRHFSVNATTCHQ